jgi:NADH:ubiquinone oxidoreductase subunit 5 (subunit L)/multisubunit Na+/H+ antiporter MnhA subunit
VPLGFTLDQLSKTMLLVVSGVGATIHIYSLGYMRDDEGRSRYFAALSLFMFAMFGIVLANNFVMLFIFWELVGFTSYVLIGHWFFRDAAADAANKAFITTRIGDFGFMIGILMVWMATGSIVFAEITPRMPDLVSHPTFVTIAALLIFCGAVGKSAQFPLHVWLPDAMEGPTPISALIHAATMVAAGVYMLVRVPAKRYQAHSGLLNVVATWLHGDGCRSRLERRGHVSPVYPCVFQSATLPRRWLDHRDASSRAEHLENGRTFSQTPSHIRHFRHWRAGADRLSTFQRILQ